MPKEMIHTENPGPTEADGSHGYPIRVKVGWFEFGEVQIAVIDTSLDEFEDLAKHASLNRTQVNHLIRTLRRARDKAYGADA